LIEAALAGAVAGYAIAIPVGAMAVLIINTGLTRGMRAGIAAGAGSATADLIYAAVAVLAGLGVNQLLGPLVGPLRLVGGAVLIGIGLRGLARLRSRRETVQPGEWAGAQQTHRRTYLELLGLTLLNPATVIYFAALTVGLPMLSGIPERLAFALAAFGASLSWQSLLAVFGAALGRGAGHRLHGPTVLIGNAVVILLGVLILLEGLKPAA
jgi:threonine/homoserine/homoserine lactone efflux protein